jgi:hypothetical protein
MQGVLRNARPERPVSPFRSVTELASLPAETVGFPAKS